MIILLEAELGYVGFLNYPLAVDSVCQLNVCIPTLRADLKVDVSESNILR